MYSASAHGIYAVFGKNFPRNAKKVLDKPNCLCYNIARKRKEPDQPTGSPNDDSNPTWRYKTGPSRKEEIPMAHSFDAVGEQMANTPTIEYDRYIFS